MTPTAGVNLSRFSVADLSFLGIGERDDLLISNPVNRAAGFHYIQWLADQTYVAPPPPKPTLPQRVIEFFYRSRVQDPLPQAVFDQPHGDFVIPSDGSFPRLARIYPRKWPKHFAGTSLDTLPLPFSATGALHEGWQHYHSDTPLPIGHKDSTNQLYHTTTWTPLCDFTPLMLIGLCYYLELRAKEQGINCRVSVASENELGRALEHITPSFGDRTILFWSAQEAIFRTAHLNSKGQVFTGEDSIDPADYVIDTTVLVYLIAELLS